MACDGAEALDQMVAGIGLSGSWRNRAFLKGEGGFDEGRIQLRGRGDGSVQAAVAPHDPQLAPSVLVARIFRILLGHVVEAFAGLELILDLFDNGERLSIGVGFLTCRKSPSRGLNKDENMTNVHHRGWLKVLAG